MKRPLLQLFQAVHASYWFIPGLMLLLAIVLGAVMVALDSGPAGDLLEGIGWYQQSKPAGAREVLSTIAGSMITVGGVVFSITIVAIAFAASQYGPRILTNFMSDRGNQIALGTFIATFAYSVAVLRTIYSGDDDFVPELSIMVAMILAVCSLVVLVYYIHHLPESLHANQVIALIGAELIEGIKERFPAQIGDPPEQSEQERRQLAKYVDETFATGDRVKRLESAWNGYLQIIDDDKLLSAACERDLVLCLRRAPGDFVFPGATLALVWPAERVDDRATEELLESFGTGTRRTPTQDQLFLIDELVEIEARALSPSINDPFTAMSCVNWLTAAAAELASRRPPSPYRLDSDRRLRVVAEPGSFADYIDRGFGRMRPYLAGDVNAAEHTMTMMGALAEQCHSPDQIECLREQLDALAELAGRKLDPRLFSRLTTVADQARQAFDEAKRRCTSTGPAHSPNG